MKKKQVLLIGGLAALVIGSIALGIRPPTAVPEVASAKEGDKVQARAVEATTVVTGSISSVLSYAGNLQAIDAPNVSASYSGRVVEVLKDVGDTVKKGDVLLRFDTTSMDIQLNQATAALQIAQANQQKMRRGSRSEELLAAQAALNLAQANLTRVDTSSDQAIETAAGAVQQAQAALHQAQAAYDKIAWADQKGELPESLALQNATIAYETALSAYNAAVKGAPVNRLSLEAALLQAQSGYAIAKNPYLAEDFAIAEANIKAAQATVDNIDYQLSNARVVSPIDGVISARYVAVGETPNQGVPLYEIISDGVEVALAIEESKIKDVYQGQPASLKLAAYPGQDFPAAVSKVEPTADVKTHTFLVKVQPAGNGVLLKPGMYADVSLLLEQHADAVIIPKSAVLDSEKNPSVFVVEDKKAVARAVSLGIEQGNYVEVLNGLAKGEQVISSGQTALEDGMPVDIVKVKPPQLD